MRGGIEAIYLALTDQPLGLGTFAPREPARKSMFSARHRLGFEGEHDRDPAVGEDEFYAK
jgi:hypothetical protein